eukprot:TRINITY_DN23495_c0_g1_i1.p1 TRINITY_DN23495_c0_g1~~TRINITY_DN23495_c0_g1_i1.p1  ORF type:complete len:170 (-),score=28.03 TRINITY_DN23495_c0_g1_i1:37-510(-)
MPTWGSSVTKFTWIFVAIVVSAELKSAWDDRQRRLAIQRRRELEKLMKVEPREEWHESDLKLYNGEDPTGPILIGVDGRVFNVYRGRGFYGTDGAYSEFAGRDATRLLAKQLLDDSEDDGAPLTSEELETMRGWKDLFAFKYDDVGPLVCQRSTKSF